MSAKLLAEIIQFHRNEKARILREVEQMPDGPYGQGEGSPADFARSKKIMRGRAEWHQSCVDFLSKV